MIQPLTEDEIQALLDVCDPAEEYGCRNRAIILLFLDTGMRKAELHQLTLADVSWEVGRPSMGSDKKSSIWSVTASAMWMASMGKRDISNRRARPRNRSASRPE